MEAFKYSIEETGPMSIEAFSYIINRLVKEAYNTFVKELGLGNIEQIPHQFSTNLFAAIVGGFNSALRRDYQYVVVGIFSDQTPALRIGSAERKTIIPGAHDIVSAKIVPIIRIKNIALLKGTMILKDLKVVDVDFGNDNLEKIN